MPLPLSVAAVPRPAVPGSSPMQQSGGAAGFEDVMNGVLASDAKTSLGTAQQTPDGGAQEKPADDRSVPVAGAAKPEASKVAKDRVDAVGVVEAAGVAGAVAGVAGAVDAAAAAAVAGGLAAAGNAAPQASGTGVTVSAKDGAVDSAVPATAVARTSAAARLTVGMTAGPTQAAPVETGVRAAVPAALPLGSLGQSPTQPGPIPASPLPASPLPAAAHASQMPGALPSSPQPTVALPAGPLRGNSLPINPLTAGLETGVTATAAQAGEPGTAVVLPVGKAGTQRDSPPVLGQDTQVAAAPALPSGIQAGAPLVGQPAPPLQEAPTTAAPGMATPTLQADPAKLLSQVSAPLFSLASAAPGSHVMTLKLSPEDLGPLTVRAHIEGAGVRIELFAPGEAGREAIRSILPELRRGLGESGFGASLDLSEHNAPADAGAGGSDPRDRRPAESPAFPRGSDGESLRQARTAVVLPRSITSSLDILV
ncbi:flagellar hook-length control protein FliK [Arthrobacter sp. efr-133-TYG-120]|uniref:flagellar hook-length control protein FliK n=1 Tax=Arthrobacter sp. efr-133-TYG-120 TaxID=3040280 RepID=UPI00254CCD26|nr:flagellar hook-length control protein FliK [Arthrobacter sp. efr-133-TYG-120]